MTSALDRALRAGKNSFAEIGDQRVLQFRIVKREVGAQLGQIEAGPLGMGGVFRVDRVDRALPQRSHQTTSATIAPLANAFFSSARRSTAFVISSSLKLDCRRSAARRTNWSRCNCVRSKRDQIVRRGRPRLEKASFRWRREILFPPRRDSRRRHPRSSAVPKNRG